MTLEESKEVIPMMEAMITQIVLFSRLNDTAFFTLNALTVD